MEQTRKDLDREASLLIKSPLSEYRQGRVKVLQTDLTHKMGMGKADLKQRSKVNWLKLGDKNSKFFSLATKIWKSRNSTLKLLNTEGAHLLTRSQMENNSVDYFTKGLKQSFSDGHAVMRWP